MPITKGFTDELKNLADLGAIGAADAELLNSLLTKINSNFEQPLRLFATFPTADAKLNISPNQVKAGDGVSKSTPPLDETITSYAGATVDFQTGAVTGGTVQRDGGAFSLPAGTVGQYRRMALVYNSAANVVNTTFSDEVATIGTLVDPGELFGSLDGVPLGYINLECTNVAGAYKTIGSATDIIENAVSGASRIFVFAGGTGAGGGALGTSRVEWTPLPGSAPVSDVESGIPVYLFEAAGSNKLVAFATVPEGHPPSRQINLQLALYSPSTSNNILMKCDTYLIRKDDDALDSTDNLHASTNTAITNGSANVLRQATIDLTDAAGAVDSVPVEPGDVLRIELSRGTDTDTADIRVVPSLSDVRF